MNILRLICAVLLLSGCAATGNCTKDPSGFCHDNDYRFNNLDGRDIRLNLVPNVNSSEAAKNVQEDYQNRYSNIYSTAGWEYDKFDNHPYCLITIEAPKGPQDSTWFLLMLHELRHCFEGSYHTVDYLPVRRTQNPLPDAPKYVINK